MSLYAFEESLIKAIQEGDLKMIEQLQLTSIDVNRKLMIHHKVPVQNIHLKRVFPELIDPTPVIFAIACEKSDVLYYFIENLHPDLSICCNGWAPIHYAAIIEDPRCMQILLKTEFVQTNVDFPIQSVLSKDISLTALNIAVSYSRHGQALLLTQNFIQPEFDLEGNRILFKNTPVIDESSILPADCLHKTVSGNTPLHIATYRNDWDMCQILMSVMPDVNVLNDKEQTPAELAKLYNHNELAEKLTKAELDPIETLIAKYLTKPSKPKCPCDEIPASEESVEEIRENINTLKETINNLYATIDSLSNNK
ncbi:hypothetical protein TVAG_065340 [Trichomonas vaginalis G3]|uniref:Uncharacterized protein n=1 Tax=Trichomonas vaginalis (strain ATCC PRA-98 / G3) TaxID=412133 RepID=A2FUW7_TRIV3|nr:ankyrin repeat family protein family [Trichomonas vaginalis G3]EAX91318.1 hypothetical protein TVAG_065340 [Trichomonas vaginalis G3]KAI5492995.1 ankyrin repeat family protein family [Trichomonas vaginalis G3]|eukprot:XP_001304248.1 hypothetical protein [Trichomonas vaginalis G3]